MSSTLSTASAHGYDHVVASEACVTVYFTYIGKNTEDRFGNLAVVIVAHTQTHVVFNLLGHVHLVPYLHIMLQYIVKTATHTYQFFDTEGGGPWDSPPQGLLSSLKFC